MRVETKLGSNIPSVRGSRRWQPEYLLFARHGKGQAYDQAVLKKTFMTAGRVFRATTIATQLYPLLENLQQQIFDIRCQI